MGCRFLILFTCQFHRRKNSFSTAIHIHRENSVPTVLAQLDKYTAFFFLILSWGNEIFSFPCSSNEVKCGIQYRYSKCNASKIEQKVENGSALMGTKCLNTRYPGSLCLPCYVHMEGFQYIRIQQNEQR